MKIVAAACSAFVCLSSLAFADDFKTTDGKDYKDATVRRVEPDGIVVTTKSGVSKIYFTELPKDVQEKFHYDPEKATAYIVEQSAALEQVRKQQEEAMRQRADAMAKNNRVFAEQEAARNAAREKDERINTLQARYNQLQRQEDELMRQLGQAEHPLSHRVSNPLAQQIPSLKGHLSDIRREKDEVRKQLGQAQRQQQR